MRVVDLIRKKRDGYALTPEEIAFLIRGYTRGEIPDYQMAAFLMATVWRGMTLEETLALTEEMVRSGYTLDWSHLPEAKVDKHSTGGVGDKTSLVLTPIVAAAGVRVPMISGRGLAHTGGTLDKLESIPGFRVQLPVEAIRRVVEQVGAVLVGQSEELVPADRKLYALRDVTATVECLPLIVASIMSKKIAEGLDALVLDVKVGKGAFMKTETEARDLAERLVDVGRRLGKRVRALITDMNQPLGRAIGNALEVIESVETLKGRGPEDLRTLSLELAAHMLVLGHQATSLEEARERAERLLHSGAALEKFRQIIEAQGGIRASWTTTRACPRRGADGSIVRMPRACSSKPMRSGSVLRLCCLGPDANTYTRILITPSASSFIRRSASASRAATRCARSTTTARSGFRGPWSMFVPRSSWGLRRLHPIP